MLLEGGGARLSVVSAPLEISADGAFSGRGGGGATACLGACWITVSSYSTILFLSLFPTSFFGSAGWGVGVSTLGGRGGMLREAVVVAAVGGVSSFGGSGGKDFLFGC